MNLNYIDKLRLDHWKQSFKIDEEDVSRLRKFRQSISKKFKTKFYDLPSDWRSRNISYLFENHCDNFDLWYYTGLVDIGKSSHLLCEYAPSQAFDVWWDPDEFNWERDSTFLIDNFSDRFDDWWDPERFNWKYSASLSRISMVKHWDTWWDPERFIYTESSVSSLAWAASHKFDIWWDAEKISSIKSFDRFSTPLICKLSHRFDVWWDPEKIYWGDSDLRNLVQYCPEHFDKWWQPDRFGKNWWYSNSCLVVFYLSEHFDKWFDKSTFNYADNLNSRVMLFNYAVEDMTMIDTTTNKPCGRHYLMALCSDKFDKWYDRKRIRPNDTNFKILTKYCSDHSGNWGVEYLIHTLKGEDA